MFIVICQQGLSDHPSSINVENYNYFTTFTNDADTVSVWAGTRVKDFTKAYEEELGDSVLLGVYPTKAAAHSVFDALMRAMLEGQKGYQCRNQTSSGERSIPAFSPTGETTWQRRTIVRISQTKTGCATWPSRDACEQRRPKSDRQTWRDFGQPRKPKPRSQGNSRCYRIPHAARYYKWRTDK